MVVINEKFEINISKSNIFKYILKDNKYKKILCGSTFDHDISATVRKIVTYPLGFPEPQFNFTIKISEKDDFTL